MASSLFEKLSESAVGIFAKLHIFFVNCLEPSNLEASLEGPNALILTLFSSSIIPFTNGISGPGITKSTFSFKAKDTISLLLLILISIHCASSAIPGFPGAQINFDISGELANDQHIACSRAPLPSTSTFIKNSYLYLNYINYLFP